MGSVRCVRHPSKPCRLTCAGHGIINADGSLWKMQRKAGLRFFSTSNLRTLINVFVPHFLKHTETHLRHQASVNAVVDLEAVFLDFTTRLMGRVAYDMHMTAASPFSRSFEFASAGIGERFQNPLWRLTELLWGGRLRKAFADVHAFGRSVVCTALANRQGAKSVDGRQDSMPPVPKAGQDSLQGSLIQSLIDAIDDPKIVADAALNFLSAGGCSGAGVWLWADEPILAGRDTTAQALTWTFYLLMRHPHVVHHLRQELRDAVEGEERLELDFDTVQPTCLPYTLAVFYESLRLYPPVPFEIKQCSTAVTLPDGTHLPPRAIVAWCPWAMNRSARIWGHDAADFRPERWLEDAADLSHLQGRRVRTIRMRTQSEFPVFNGGPRTCLGKQMAELQSVYAIASLVRDFDFVEHVQGQGSSPRRSRNSLTLPMEGGLPCQVKLAPRQVPP